MKTRLSLRGSVPLNITAKERACLFVHLRVGAREKKQGERGERKDLSGMFLKEHSTMLTNMGVFQSGSMCMCWPAVFLVLVSASAKNPSETEWLTLCVFADHHSFLPRGTSLSDKTHFRGGSGAHIHKHTVKTLRLPAKHISLFTPILGLWPSDSWTGPLNSHTPF